MYKGLTYQVPCSEAGFNHSPNLDQIPPTALVDPSRNINLHENGIRKRGGTSHVNSSAISGTPQVMGIHDYQLSASQFLVMGTTDGKLWKNFTETIKEGLGTGKIVRMLTFGGLCFFYNGYNIPQYWNGVAVETSNIAAPAADWIGTSYPSWAVVHSNGLARRIWVGGCSSTPYSIYASKVGDGGDYTTAPLSFYVETGTGDGIVGAFELGTRLFCMSKRNAFYINDTSTDSDYWGYEKAIWNGGLAHHGLIAVTPNDVHLMAEDGEIYSFTAVQSYGDYKMASLTRPSYVHKWISDNIDLSKIAQFHAVYDPVIRAVKWFLVKTGSSQVNICLPFFLDRPIDKAWGAPHENSSYNSGYKASCSALVKKSAGNWKIYTGDYAGFVWELETANRNDNSQAYDGRSVWPRLNFADSRVTKHYNRAIVVSQPSGTSTATLSMTIDDLQTISGTLYFAATQNVFGTGVFGTAVFTEGIVSDTSLRIGTTGKRIQPDISCSILNTDLFLSNLLIDHKSMGRKEMS